MKNFVSQLSTLVEKLTAILQPKKYSKPEKPNGGHGFFLYNSPLKSPPHRRARTPISNWPWKVEMSFDTCRALPLHFMTIQTMRDCLVFGGVDNPPVAAVRITAANLRQAGYRSYLTRSG